jgi:hypothetical protein
MQVLNIGYKMLASPIKLRDSDIRSFESKPKILLWTESQQSYVHSVFCIFSF